MSSTAPHLFGERSPQFENDLREVLAAGADSRGQLGVRLPDNELEIWRPARP